MKPKVLDPPLGSIRQEAAACRKAFANVKVGRLVWHCHHGQGIEILHEAPGNRIRFILNHKMTHEQALRLRLFRPITAADMRSAPKSIRLLFDAYRKKQRASSAWYTAQDALINALYAAGVQTMHRKLCGCPWRFGKADIFGK